MNRFPTLFIIDESASLKRFDRLLEAIGRMRGYGVQFWLHLQALGQARLIYGEAWDLIPGLAGIVQYFGGTADKTTAVKMSEAAGKKTIVVPGSTVSFGDKPGGTNSSSLTGRDNFMPDEIMRYPLPQQLVEFVGYGVTEGRLIHPSMNDFPVYQTFMQAIEEGYTAEQAESAARACEMRSMRAAPVTRAKPQPQRQSRRSFSISSDWFDKVVSKLMGHEKD